MADAQTYDITLIVTCTDEERDALMEEVLELADGRGFGAAVHSALAADAPAPEPGTRTGFYDAQTRCENCGAFKAWTPTETVEGRPGFKCERCQWWTWLADAPAPEETLDAPQDPGKPTVLG